MRNAALHDALRNFALEAAALLTADLEAGAELSFEIEEEPGGQSVLYRYRPLTEEFVAERWARLRALPTAPAAARALGAGAEAYLQVRGEPGGDAEPALRAMLERLWEDASSLAFPEERFETVYAEVERTLLADTMALEIVVPVLGAEIDEDRIALGPGVSLVSGRSVDAPPEAVWPGWADHRDPEPSVLCLLELPSEDGAALPLDAARRTYAELQTGLRLWASGALAFGPLAWVRANRGPWRSFALGSSGSVRGEAWRLRAEEAGELRTFLDAVGSAGRAGTVGWALGRFEMGCGRGAAMEALSDYLLALSALLEGRDEVGRASLSLRLAALCAEEDERRALQRRMELVFALERFFVSGGSGEGYLQTVGSESPHGLVLEVEEHLRSLLRDVLCGYLDADLRGTADDILLESSRPAEIRVRDMRAEPRPSAPPAPERPRRFARTAAPAGAGIHAGRQGDGEEDPPPGHPVGVTASADWAHDDDAASYSAPV